MGAAIATEMVHTGSVLTMCREHVQPFYREKMELAVSLARHYFKDLDIAIHRPEGAFFLWMWFRGLPVGCHQLYQRLKTRGVVVVPGHYFFFGLKKAHPHQDQCLRINYAQDKAVVEAGFRIIADEVETLMK